MTVWVCVVLKSIGVYTVLRNVQVLKKKRKEGKRKLKRKRKLRRRKFKRKGKRKRNSECKTKWK